MRPTKSERRDERAHNRRKHGVSGKSVFLIVEIQVRRAEKIKKSK